MSFLKPGKLYETDIPSVLTVLNRLSETFERKLMHQNILIREGGKHHRSLLERVELLEKHLGLTYEPELTKRHPAHYVMKESK